MMHKPLLVSCFVSALLIGALEGKERKTNPEKEYQVDFVNGAGLYKKPIFSPDLTLNTNFTWNSDNGIFVLKTEGIGMAGKQSPTITATFTSDQSEYGILVLKKFSFSNAPKGASEIVAPTTEDGKSGKLTESQMIFKNGATGFRSFVLGGSGENINIFSGANLGIEDFAQTTFEGTININSGGVSKDATSSGYLPSSLFVKSQKDYSVFTMKATLNLITNNGQPNTQERAVALFSANVKGNISFEGYANVANQAELKLESGNAIKVSSTISVAAQEAKKIIEDALGNQSIRDEDRVKKTNLILKAPKIDLTGYLDIGLHAREMQTQEYSIGNGELKKVVITQLPSDIGVIADITADIQDKQTPTNGEKPEDWIESNKAQFWHTGGRISIGKNSEVRIKTINEQATDSKKIFDDKDPYAIKLNNITIQEQNKGNQILNLDIQAQSVESSEIRTDKASIQKASGVLAEGAGKVFFGGRVELEANANARIQAYDGFDFDKNSSFNLGEDSLLWLSVGERNFVSTNEGKFELNGGALVLGEKYTNQSQNGFDVSLTNVGSMTLSKSIRKTTKVSPTDSNTPSQDVEKVLDPSGLFLFGQKNTLDNQGEIIFDGSGNLSSISSFYLQKDEMQRDLEIINSKKGQRGVIQVNGANNTLTSGGGIKISSQDIAISEKILDDKNKTKQDGEFLILALGNNPQSKIVFGEEKPDSSRDRVNVTGGTLKLISKHAGVESYNLRLVDTVLDLTGLSFQKNNQASNQPESADVYGIGGGNTFVNKRRLELGGNVKIYLSNNQGAFLNGDYKNQVNHFEEKLPVIKIKGENEILASMSNNTQNSTPNSAFNEGLDKARFSVDNYANIELQSNALLKIDGDFYHNGTLVFNADTFGVGSILTKGDIIFDMTSHQGGDQTVNPLIAVKHINFYSLVLDRVYPLIQTTLGEVKYRVGSALIVSQQSGPTPRKEKLNQGTAREEQNQEDTLTYSKQQEYLQTEIENFLNGTGVYEGNENKLGIFLQGKAIVDYKSVGFVVTRSNAIADIKPTSSQTGVIDQYLDILAKSDGQISNNKTQEMVSHIQSSNSNALKVLNNALEAKNSLELKILKDIGSYNTPALSALADTIDSAMQTMAEIQKPLIEDFQKMQIVREIAVQNRLMRFSNPYVAEIELAQYIQKLAKNRYAQATQVAQSDVLPSYVPQDEIKSAYKNSFWVSAISSTTKEANSNSALYGFNVGYEYMPIFNVLLGAYVAYGYSNFKAETLKNNAHNIDASIYTRLYYGNSEVDITASYMHMINDMKVDVASSDLNQKLDFSSNAFDVNLKYGYIFKISKVKGLFIKPQGSFTIYGINIPQINGISQNTIVYDQKMKGGMIFNLGTEIRQYVSAYSYLYILPSFEYDLNNQNSTDTVYFSGAQNKLQYTSMQQAKGLFSLYVGGEGYISPDFSMNLSAGYKTGLDKEEHNISITAGFKYKF